jgi:hypothetical protein
MKKLILTTLVFSMFLTRPGGSSLAFEWLEGDLSVRGNVQQTLNIRTHEDMRDVRYSSFRSMFRMEGMYKILSTAHTTMRLYALGNYYYDFGLDLDSNARHAIRNESGKDDYRDFRRPRNSEEWLTELYFDLTYKDIQIKLGKQLVSWGETAESQVADLINPLDLKYMLAFPDWEDFKVGLWMIRLYYTPKNVWQELSFELLVIPFDFEETRYPPAGSGLFFGGAPMPNHMLQRIFDTQRRDAPKDGSNCFEIGLRIKGFANVLEGIDWAVSHFYTRLDSPLIDGPEGFNRLFRMIAFNRPPGGKVYTYPHYNSTAVTFATTWDKIGSSVRGECTFNSNRDYQYGNAGEIKEKDVVTTAISISRATMMPWISKRNRNTSFSLTFTWYQYWLLNHEYDKSTGEYIVGETGKDSTRTKFVLSAATGFWFYRIIPIFNFVYDTNGNTTVVGGLSFAPGDHWSWIGTYQQINESGAGRYQNQVTLSMRYEFW